MGLIVWVMGVNRWVCRQRGGLWLRYPVGDGYMAFFQMAGLEVGVGRLPVYAIRVRGM